MNHLGEVLTCSVCLELFKEPRQLLCGHCFCLSCLEQLSSPRCCPECRTELLKEPEDLAPDYKLQQLLELLNKETKHSCFYCEIKMDESINVCSHCKKRFCQICLSQHWRAMIIEKSEVLQESLRGFQTPEEFREHCQSVVLEGMRTAQKECHSLIDRLFSKNTEATQKRYDKTNVLLPGVQLITESGLSANGNYEVVSPEVYDSIGKELTECHESLEKMYEDVTSDLQNIKDCVSSLNFSLRWMLPGPRICNPNDWPKIHEVPVDEMIGTRKVNFDAPCGKDYEIRRGATIDTLHQCISAMKQYCDYSQEELRWVDYATERPLNATVYHASTAILTAAGPGKRYAGLINAFENSIWKMPEENALYCFLFGYEPDTLENENMPSHTISTSDLLQNETSASEDPHTPVDAVTTENNTDIGTNNDEGGGENSFASQSDDLGNSVSVKCDLGDTEARDGEHLGLATPFEQVVKEDVFQESIEGKDVTDEVVGESE